jgi:Ca-activated chloride channel homolog
LLCPPDRRKLTSKGSISQPVCALTVKIMPASKATLLAVSVFAVTFPLFPLAFAPLACGQSDLDDVHLLPRIRQETPVRQSPALDPALDTHTKPIRKDVDLVLVPVTITDTIGRLVTGLDQSSFQVFEGKQQQEIRHFSSEDAPVSLGIIFDVSGSMKDKMARAREAVLEFCNTANPEDEFFMITFSDRPELAADFTSRIEDVENHLVSIAAKGRTALLDAIYLGVNKMREAKYARKALLVISDGGDNRSRYTPSEIKSLVREADVMIYAIGTYDRQFRTQEELLGPELLDQVASATGGRAFTLDNPNQLPETAGYIGRELRNQYVLGYRPAQAPRDGKWHKIKVTLKIPKGLPSLLVKAKPGYYASPE